MKYGMHAMANNLTRIRAGHRALALLFGRPGDDGTLVLHGGRMVRLLDGLLQSAAADPLSPRGCCTPADYLNEFLREYGSSEKLAARLLGALFEAFIGSGVSPREFAAAGSASPTLRFLLSAAWDLVAVLRRLPVSLGAAETRRLLPAARAVFDDLPQSSRKTDAALAELADALASADPFGAGRAFRRFRGEFLPTELDSAKPIGKFFGFPGIRAIFSDHFRKFSAGISSVPLLVSSLPGCGKTSMTVSYALAEPDTVLILPEPEELESGWEALIAPLLPRTDRRFVLFFDDIDPRKVDWYNFRTHVGGAYSLPPHIMIVLAANYEFPAGILSRGRRVTYPVFDELRCTEMIEDFLRDFGLKNPPVNLVNLIGADYTEEFGQKKFTELSPRTLMRYLNIYCHDQRKRRTMVEMAMGPLVTKPVGELFYEFNIELMRSLYGEEYIQRLLKEKLRSL